MIASFVWQIALNGLAIYTADLILKNFTLNGPWWLYLIAGLILGLINAIIKPIVKLITLPIRLLTLGLFNIAINVFLLWLLTQFMPELAISGAWTWIFSSIIIGSINAFFYASKKD